MEITELLDRSNRMFELLEYTDHYSEDDEIVSLKISLNNLLISLGCDQPNFFEVFMLSSPVLFDFAFNSKIEDIGLKLRSTFERNKEYEQQKKWYKFIRNSLIHTNRYTYSNFLKSIYRIEYSNCAKIYFELDTERIYRFDEFTNNQFYLENQQFNSLQQIDGDTRFENNVCLVINYEYFNQFVYQTIERLVRSVEHDIDAILNSEVNRWNNYYSIYQRIVNSAYIDREIDVKQLKQLAKSLKILKKLDLEEAYVLCEFLVYLINLEQEIDQKQLDDITKITTFDKYYQIEERTLILNQISPVKDYQRIYIDYEQVAWLINEIFPLSPEGDQRLQKLEHTNYLIMYVQKYLKVKGEF